MTSRLEVPTPTNLLLFVVIVGLVGAVFQLQAANRDLHYQLDRLGILECSPVHVECVCPDYDQGWEDAAFAEGCDSALDEMSFDELKVMCQEIEDYGEIPGC
jgi:hypothetical protein